MNSELELVGRNDGMYGALVGHQLAQVGWDYQSIISELHRYREVFNSEFKLALSPTAFRIGGARSNCYGHFRPGHNDFGLTREIAFNQTHLLNRLAANEFWRVLGTLLHELLHAWQFDHGRPSLWRHHNREFRNKAESLGLIVSANGVTDFASDSPFLKVLAKHGVNIPKFSSRQAQVVRGSKLKKWVCSCAPPVNVRVAISDFQAMCLRCNCVFRRSDD